MRSGAAPLVGWGLGVIAIALLGALAFDLGALPALLLAGAGATCAAVGGAAWLAERRRPRPGRADLLLRSSAATLVLTVGGTLAFVGAVVVGTALLWPGIGLVAVGASGLVRELRAQRRLLDERSAP